MLCPAVKGETHYREVFLFCILSGKMRPCTVVRTVGIRCQAESTPMLLISRTCLVKGVSPL